MHTLKHREEKEVSTDRGAFRFSLDSLGVVASSLCIIHCLVLPLAVVALPALGPQVIHDDSTHFVLAFFVTMFCLLAIVPGYMRHNDRNVLFVMSIGLSMVLFATFIAGHALGESWEVPLITIGNLLVVGAHLQNRKLLACSSC